uniref:Post-SET domain-containing protein n=2 Tax=Globodera pallida TaxID=36090 RepID=A0A183BQG2_GLOPA
MPTQWTKTLSRLFPTNYTNNNKYDASALRLNLFVPQGPSTAFNSSNIQAIQTLDGRERQNCCRGGARCRQYFKAMPTLPKRLFRPKRRYYNRVRGFAAECCCPLAKGARGISTTCEPQA